MKVTLYFDGPSPYCERIVYNFCNTEKLIKINNPDNLETYVRIDKTVEISSKDHEGISKDKVKENGTS